MVMDMEFQNISELYARVRPALSSKKKELYMLGFNYIKEEDIWNALKINKWSNTQNLTLAEMVNDILNIDNYFIDDYCKDIIKNTEKIPNLE